MLKSHENEEKLIEWTSSLILIDRKKTIKNLCAQREERKQLDPVERKLQSQMKSPGIILEMGGTQMSEYFASQKNVIGRLFNQKREMLRKRIDYQFQKEIASVESEVKAEYAKTFQEFVDNTEAKINESLRATKTEINIKCEEKIKQHVVSTKKILLTNIEMYLSSRENNLKLEFGKFKEKNLKDFNEYYQQLIKSDCLRHENHLKDINKEHNEKYENMKTFLKNKYKKTFNLAKKKFEKKLLSQNLGIISKPSVCDNDEKKQRKMESIEKQIVEKLEKLNRTNLQIELHKRKIRSVLNNYANVVSLTKKRGPNLNYLMDKNKMLNKYLSRPSEDDFQKLILDEELFVMTTK